jgi:hypothetical protein
MPKGSRKQADEALAAALAGGNTVEGAAHIAGVSRATAFRRLKDPDFKGRIDVIRAEMIDRTLGHLSAGATEGSIVLRTLAVNSKDERIKLGASKALVDSVLRVRDSVILEERIKALEEAAARRKKGGR